MNRSEVLEVAKQVFVGEAMKVIEDDKGESVTEELGFDFDAIYDRWIDQGEKFNSSNAVMLEGDLLDGVHQTMANIKEEKSLSDEFVNVIEGEVFRESVNIMYKNFVK